MEKQTVITRFSGLLSRHPVIMLCCTGLGILGSAIWLYMQPVQYQAQSVIQVPDSGNKTTVALFDNETTSAATEELTSEAFLTLAMNSRVNPVRTFMTQELRTSETTSMVPYTIKFTPTGKQFRQQSYVLTPLDSKTFRLESTMDGISRSKSGTFGEEVIDRDLAITIEHKQNTPWHPEPIIGTTKWSFTIQPPVTAARELSRSSDALQVTEENGVVSIIVTQQNPVRAKAITGAITETYLSQYDVAGSNPGTAVDEMDFRLEILSKKLMVTESRIATYKRENQISDITFDTEKSLAQLKELQLQKTTLEVNMAALNNLSKYLRKNREGNNSRAEYGALQDPVFSDQMNQLNLKYDQRSKTGANPTLDAEIEQLKNTISERLLNTRKKTAVQIDRISVAIAVTQNMLGSMPEKANTLLAMNRELQIHQKVYDKLVEKRAEALVTGTGVSQGIRILQPTTVRATPTNYITWLTYMTGIMSGIILGIVFSRFREKMSRSRITTREELSAETGIPYMGAVSFTTGKDTGSDTSYQDLCTRILMRPSVKIITFASTGRGEGKTFVATRFAQALAAMDKKVLLIDMNHLNPEVSEYFDVSPERTMADVLDGTCDIHDAVCITSRPNCDMMVSGELPAGINSLIISRKRETIFNDLKKHYDFIVVDTPETGMVIDAIPMMHWSDLTLYVVRANTTRKQSLHVAEQIKADYGIENLFFVLNASKRTLPASRNRTTRNRNNTRQIQANKMPKYVPEVLRKIALWFY